MWYPFDYCASKLNYLNFSWIFRAYGIWMSHHMTWANHVILTCDPLMWLLYVCNLYIFNLNVFNSLFIATWLMVSCLAYHIHTYCKDWLSTVESKIYCQTLNYCRAIYVNTPYGQPLYLEPDHIITTSREPWDIFQEHIAKERRGYKKKRVELTGNYDIIPSIYCTCCILHCFQHIPWQKLT